jgi:hypothetical protein
VIEVDESDHEDDLSKKKKKITNKISGNFSHGEFLKLMSLVSRGGN